MEYYNSLIAGADDPGYQDGEFDLARFNHPEGMAIDSAGKNLYVADTNNHCIRIIHLDKDNQVETLAGTGSEDETDGDLLKASFKQPTAIVVLSADQLIVYDMGSRRLRMVDLKSRKVSTLKLNPDGPVSIWNMVYRSPENSLYYSDPDNQQLMKLDLKTGIQTILLQKDSLLPSPLALSLNNDHLYVADKELPDVYEVEWGTTTLNAHASGMLNKVGKGDHILALSAMGDKIYALQKGSYPIALISPESKPVTLPTAWGFMTNGEMQGAFPLFNLRDVEGFAISPLDDGKLYVASYNSIISIKDYNFAELWKSLASGFGNPHINDFDYPEKKPDKTFRILVLGDSRTWISPVINPDTGDEGAQLQATVQTNRVFTFPKQLEFMLNTDASLKGLETHFEVITMGGISPIDYVSTVLPIIEKYHFDLVIFLACYWHSFATYFDRPITPDGVPGPGDPEYLLKPFEERISPGLTKDLYDRFQSKGLMKDKTHLPSDDNVFNSKDTGIHEDLVQMVGKPLQIFGNKIKSLKNPDGTSPTFLISYVPWKYNGNDQVLESFWTDTCKKMNLPLLDLSQAYLALKPSFYPTDQSCCTNHYTVYGNNLIAYLLKYYLFDQGWVPSLPKQESK